MVVVAAGKPQLTDPVICFMVKGQLSALSSDEACVKYRRQDYELEGFIDHAISRARECEKTATLSFTLCHLVTIGYYIGYYSSNA